MAKIRFENGITVNFDGNPTPQDIEEVASGFSQAKAEPKRSLSDTKSNQFKLSDFLKNTLAPINPMTEEGRQNLITPGMIPYKTMTAMNDEIAKTGVPAMQKIPLLKDIPFGARLAGDPNAILNTMTAFSNPSRQIAKTGLSEVAKRSPKIMGKNYTIENAAQGAKALDETRSALGTTIKNILSKTKATVNAPALNKELPKLPQNVMTALDDPIYGIKKLPDGSFSPSVQNMQRLKEALDDFMTSKTWNEATKMSQRQVKRAYGAVSQAMKTAEPDLVGPMGKYSKFMKSYRTINKTVRDPEGNLVEKPLRGVFKLGAERKTQLAWEKFAQDNPNAAQVVKNMKKYNNRQVIKGATSKLAGAGVVYEILRRTLGRI